MRPYYPTRYTLLAYILAALSLTVGCVVSYLYNDWSWLSRSGCVIVVIGIVFTSSQIIENSRRMQKRYRGAHRGGNFHRDWGGEKQHEILLHAREHSEDNWVMSKCGFNLLVVGTFVWGFGDLVGVLFM